MPLVLNHLDKRLAKAVKSFWKSQEGAMLAKKESSRPDTGKRGAVTSGKHLNAFVDLIGEIVQENGLEAASLRRNGSDVTIPGFFRATKDWDLLIIHNGMLVAAIELKSMGSSFGNNLNNRAEEILGQSLDFTKAHERRVFRDCPKPFLGYCVILADSPKIHKPVSAYSPHFAVLPEFVNAGYAERFNLLCRKMVEEEMYTEAALILSDPVTGAKSGKSCSMSDVTSFRRFITGLAAHTARIAAL
jgi:hypothetical protein